MAYAVPITSTWKLIFDEEFLGTSLDLSKWTPNWLGAPGQITKPINSSELNAYDPAQVTVKDGKLHLAAVARPTLASDGKTYAYASGCITSNGKFNPSAPLFVEALITCPGSGGMISNWPAFWLNGQNWPADGEIDIFEGLGGKAAAHLHNSAGGPGFTAPGDFVGTHHYACLWNATTAQFFYDGNLIWTVGGVPGAPKFIILDYALGQWGGPQVVPAEMTVAYVHAYSDSASVPAVAPQAGYGGPGDADSGGGSPPPPSTDYGPDIAVLKARVASLETQVAGHEGRLDKISTGAAG